ncbi:activating enzyme E1 regulatory subunit [Seminavis robusta]|uniref:NEDD8-activating enzyme E1 regulatory subunit n=1 Tax=Seminavis robusta TaxID=568900 RepID=A0A9N8EK11_9STRA|nr:activating enzyme E1 regulatory subunit [Seminavis robusta]|eukprot:Sro1231_g254620.1 activating enzyme E1 regulatory subunit (538) ;mRNA; r:12984-14597
MSTNKYDRQLRLWGAKGQKALGETTLVLFRATAVGTESAKNLVLPGIGHVLVVDDAASAQKEYSSNFFLVNQDKNRAQLSWELLQELNPDVQGSFLHVAEGLSTACAKPEWWTNLWQTVKTPKILVIASDLEPGILQMVGQACAAKGVPVISVQAYGMLGICRLQTPPLPLMDPKPANTTPDLRLVRPFPGLQNLADGILWDELKSHEHSHVPYPLILAKVAKEWKSSHGGALPKTHAEKQEFRDAIKAASRDIGKEVNFEEAMKNAYTAYTERSLDLDHLASLRDSVDGLVATQPSLKTFGDLLHALDKFLKEHDNQPPLHGAIPDMTASTEGYVTLQNAYRDQAKADLAEMRQYLSSGDVSEEDLSTFCHNVHLLELYQTRTLVDEMAAKVTEELQEDWMMATMDPYEVPAMTPFLWYLGFRACQVFHQEHSRYPGVLDAWEEDVSLLQECVVKVVTSLGLQENDLVKSTLLAADPPKFAQELARYGQAEIHSISSLIGGVASQEAVKIITGQYVPLNNTYVYNGIVSVAAVYQC